MPVLRSPDAKSQLVEKTLMLGKIDVKRGQQRMRWLDGITDSVDMCVYMTNNYIFQNNVVRGRAIVFYNFCKCL